MGKRQGKQRGYHCPCAAQVLPSLDPRSLVRHIQITGRHLGYVGLER